MKRLIFLFLILPLSSVFAEDYYWTNDNDNTHYSSAIDACRNDKTPYVGTAHKVSQDSPDRYWCNALAQGNPNYFLGNVYRHGNSCPAGTTYSAETGECKSDNPCLNKPPMHFSKSGTAPDGYMQVVTVGGKPKAVQSTEGCFGGCLASTTDQKCTTKTSGPYFCRGTAYFSGQACAAGSPGVDQSESSTRPEPQVTTEDKPCNYTTNADGTQSCTSTKSTEQEGQVCGTVSATGQQICVDKQPTKNGVDIATNVSTKTNTDGTKETTKTDTATTTKCDGILSCTTSVTKVSTTVKTDANGKTTSATGSCTGANCPDKNTNPDGNGDGFGDCVSGDCGDGDGEGGGPSLPGLDDVDSYQTTTQKFYDKVKASPVATSVNAIAVPDNGAPPNFKTGSIAFLGGVSLDFGIIGQLWAGVADVLHLVMKAVWCFVAVVIFLMA